MKLEKLEKKTKKKFRFDDTSPKNGSEAQKQAIELLLTGSEAPFKKNIKPEYIRLAPPLHISSDEVINFCCCFKYSFIIKIIFFFFKLLWLDPIDCLPEFAWDNTILNSANILSSNTSEIRKLISKAYKTPLNITQQKQLENVFNKDPSLILHVDLTPSKVTYCFFFC